jgi:S-adenosyl methyltransferase
MPPGIATTKPHSARMYDYFLNGKDHYAADRETAEKAIASWPSVRRPGGSGPKPTAAEVSWYGGAGRKPA